MKVKVDYTTDLPLEGLCPSVLITATGYYDYEVSFINNDTGEVLFKGITKANVPIKGSRQYYTNWKIKVEKLEDRIDPTKRIPGKENEIYEEIFNCTNKTVMIKMDAYALGDNLAWIPYVEEFRIKHNCRVICSTFYNEYFKSEYPEIIFIPPQVKVDNVYAQYYIGTLDFINPAYSPSCYRFMPLQKVAADILGLEYREIKPKVIIPKPRNPIYGKYVCISENTSLPIKNWGAENGWQDVVDFLNEQGFLVFVISKEPTQLKNVIDKTGDIPLYDRIVDIKHAQFYIGCSSGLAWLSWAIGTHVVMISDFTPPWHEFQSEITRIFNPNTIKTQIDYHKEPGKPVSSENVINYLKSLIKY